MKVSKTVIRKSHVGYVYSDGIVLIEKRQVGSGKYKKEVEIAHIFPGEIRLTGSVYSDDYALYDKIHSLVIHNPETLLSGIQYARITVNDKSEKMREIGVITNNVMVQWITDDGASFTMHQYAFLHSDIQVRFEDVTNPVNQFITASGKGSVNEWRQDRTVDFIEEY